MSTVCLFFLVYEMNIFLLHLYFTWYCNTLIWNDVTTQYGISPFSFLCTLDLYVYFFINTSYDIMQPGFFSTRNNLLLIHRTYFFMCAHLYYMIYLPMGVQLFPNILGQSVNNDISFMFNSGTPFINLIFPITLSKSSFPPYYFIFHTVYHILLLLYIFQ